MRGFLLAALLLPSPATGARASTLSVSCDPRIELLGVVQRLAFPLEHASDDTSTRFDAAPYAAFAAHPAVTRYRAALEENRGRDPYGLILLALSDPPALAWNRKPESLSEEFITASGGRARLEVFLSSLRDFSAASGFPERYRSSRGLYDDLTEEVRRGLGTRDLLGALETYLGMTLQTRMHVIVSPFYQPRYFNSYIFPYPYGGPGIVVKGPIEAFTLAGPENTANGIKPHTVWNEPLYIIVERGYARHGKRVNAYQRLRTRMGADCPGNDWPTCANHIIMMALNGRLNERILGTQPVWPAPPLGRFEKRLSERLLEYEENRRRYPTFLDFYPRLVSAFGELEAELDEDPAEYSLP